MIAMDTKLGRIYCAISDIRILLYFQLQQPQNFKELMGVYKSVSEL